MVPTAWFTYGAPAAGNKAFLALLPPGHRVVNEHDIAPCWPEEIGEASQPMPEDWLCGGSLIIGDHRGVLNLSIPDHSIDQAYLPHLRFIAKLGDQRAASLLIGAELSNIAYETDVELLKGDLIALGFTFVSRIENDACSCFFALENATGAVWLVFQGTRVQKNADPREWLDDIQTDLVDIGGGRKVTWGPWEALGSIWPQVEGQIRSLNLDRGFMVAGHSLGGWFTMLALEKIRVMT